MSEEFKIEIVNPEKSFLVKEDTIEVVVPAFEGEMGILKDHISIGYQRCDGQCGRDCHQSSHWGVPSMMSGTAHDLSITLERQK